MEVSVLNPGPDSGDAKLGEEFRVGAGDHVGGDQLADAAGGIGSGIDGSLDAADIAFDEDGHEAATDLEPGFGLEHYWNGKLGFCVCMLSQD